MNPGIRARLTRLAKILGRLLAIELVLPGGTVLVLACLLSGGRLSALVPVPCARGEAGSTDSATGSPERPGGAGGTRG